VSQRAGEMCGLLDDHDGGFERSGIGTPVI
jgi:hypothetical protein